MEAKLDQALRERREAIVREHIEAEQRQDVEAVIATFHAPRYEVNGEVSEGEEAVRDLLEELLTAFPDFHVEVETLHHSDDALIVEGRVTGTHNGPFAGVPPTGRRVEYPGAAFFLFEEDRLLCERLYFDSATILQQLGVIPEPN